MEEKKTPWETYSEQAIDPFGNSMLGQTLNQQREDRLRQQLDENEAQQFWQDFMEQGGARQNEEIPNPDVMMMEDPSLLDAAIMGSSKPFAASMLGWPVKKASEKLLKKGVAKTFAKGLGKVGSRFIPGVGWALGAADLVDYFGYPIYDHIPGGDYLTWRDTSEGEEE
tara:strand:- start:62 stop:565 length:504 start_codon:yes stop_codon:yes gene_type:complete